MSMFRFIRPGLLVLTCAALIGCATQKESGSSSSAKSNWIVLFDGKAADGLRGYKQDSFPATGWAIEDGTLKTVPNVKRVDLITHERFKDFELELEWKVSPSGNSGVFYGVQETDGPTYSTGPEMQILDDSKHRDGGKPLTAAGSFYALIGPNDSKQIKPLGEFNHAKVVSKNGIIEHWLNGSKILEYDWNSSEIKTLIARSKFSTMPRFMESLEGHIGLQHHGEEVWFRNVRIRRI
ncbi:MAG: DUF1080 domain-containing protein [Verrucomicrobia bacterium]|nr:DUF1080 domain-containing protein [Verrucomicrobiota bacterium]